MLNRTLIAVVPVLFAAGCAATTANLPAISESPTGTQATGRIVWHDLITDTPAESRRFYGELFGWEFETPAGGVGVGGADSYWLIRHDGELIGGMVDQSVLNRDADISQWITVMSVADIEAAVGRVAEQGGNVLTPPTDVGARGTLAVVASPDRAIIALLQARDGVPAEREPVVNGWLWSELWTDDVDAATGFYEAVAELRREDREVTGSAVPYRLLTDGTRPRAGILPSPFPDELPVWVSYLRVEDPAAITARVESLGGRVVVDAQPRRFGGTVAFILGPSGAGIALQTWPLDK